MTRGSLSEPRASRGISLPLVRARLPLLGFAKPSGFLTTVTSISPPSGSLFPFSASALALALVISLELRSYLAPLRGFGFPLPPPIPGRALPLFLSGRSALCSPANAPATGRELLHVN